jgi:hypothetical protein
MLYTNTVRQVVMLGMRLLRMRILPHVVATTGLSILYARVPPITHVSERDSPEVVASPGWFGAVSHIPLATYIDERELPFLRQRLLDRRHWLALHLGFQRGQFTSSLRPCPNEGSPVGLEVSGRQKPGSVPPMVRVFPYHKIAEVTQCASRVFIPLQFILEELLLVAEVL